MRWHHLAPILLLASFGALTACQTTRSPASRGTLPFSAANFLELGTTTVDEMREALAEHRGGRVERALPVYHRAYRRANQLERAGGPRRDAVKVALEQLIAHAYVVRAETVAHDPRASESEIHRALSRLEEALALHPSDDDAFALWQEMDAWQNRPDARIGHQGFSAHRCLRSPERHCH